MSRGPGLEAPAVEVHPQPADASQETLDQVLGAISLTGPLPACAFEGEHEEDFLMPGRRASH